MTSLEIFEEKMNFSEAWNEKLINGLADEFIANKNALFLAFPLTRTPFHAADGNFHLDTSSALHFNSANKHHQYTIRTTL